MNILSNEALIICSDGRWNRIQKLITYLKKVSHIPSHIIWIISKIPPIEIYDQILSLSEKNEFIELDNSLTKKRNMGIQSANNANIIHFIDDDFFPEPSYFYHLSNHLNKQKSEVVGGLIKPFKFKQTTFLKRFLLLEDDRPGIILKSGRTTEPQSRDDVQAITKVNFLSGCSMSFKKHVFQKCLFDENLKGYGMDEDLDMCLQVQSKGYTINVNGNAVGFHEQTDEVRINQLEKQYQKVVNRFYVLKKHNQIDPFIFTINQLLLLLILLKSPIKNKAIIQGQLLGLKKLFTSLL